MAAIAAETAHAISKTVRDIGGTVAKTVTDRLPKIPTGRKIASSLSTQFLGADFTPYLLDDSTPRGMSEEQRAARNILEEQHATRLESYGREKDDFDANSQLRDVLSKTYDHLSAPTENSGLSESEINLLHKEKRKLTRQISTVDDKIRRKPIRRAIDETDLTNEKNKATNIFTKGKRKVTDCLNAGEKGAYNLEKSDPITRSKLRKTNSMSQDQLYSTLRKGVNSTEFSNDYYQGQSAARKLDKQMDWFNMKSRKLPIDDDGDSFYTADSDSLASQKQNESLFNARMDSQEFNRRKYFNRRNSGSSLASHSSFSSLREIPDMPDDIRPPREPSPLPSIAEEKPKNKWSTKKKLAVAAAGTFLGTKVASGVANVATNAKIASAASNKAPSQSTTINFNPGNHYRVY